MKGVRISILKSFRIGFFSLCLCWGREEIGFLFFRVFFRQEIHENIKWKNNYFKKMVLSGASVVLRFKIILCFGFDITNEEFFGRF